VPRLRSLNNAKFGHLILGKIVGIVAMLYEMSHFKAKMHRIDFAGFKGEVFLRGRGGEEREGGKTDRSLTALSAQ